MGSDLRPDGRHLASVVRGTLLLRLAAAAGSVPTLRSTGAGSGAEDAAALLALVAVLAASLLPLLRWGRIAVPLLARPLWLALDLAAALVFLSAAGVQAPFVVATVATAFLGGLLFATPGAVVTGGLLLLGHVALALAAAERGSVEDPVGLVTSVGLLYPLLAAAGVGLRALLAELDRARRAEAAATAQAAASEERLRLARDLHDSVGKTLHGIALSAAGLRGADPATLPARLEEIQRGATLAGNEARLLMHRLREPAMPPLLDCLEQLADRLAAGGTDLRSDLAPDVEVPARVRSELVAAVREGVENVRRHAGECVVELAARRVGDRVVVRVVDHGRGLDPGRAAQAAGEGRLGIVGVRERLAAVGGHASWSATPGGGTTLELVVPCDGGAA